MKSKGIIYKRIPRPLRPFDNLNRLAPELVEGVGAGCGRQGSLGVRFDPSTGSGHRKLNELRNGKSPEPVEWIFAREAWGGVRRESSRIIFVCNYQKQRGSFVSIRHEKLPCARSIRQTVSARCLAYRFTVGRIRFPTNSKVFHE